MIACIADVVDGEEVRRLTGRGQDRRNAALERRDLLRNEVVRRVCKPRIEVAGRLQVEEVAHMLRRVVLERRRLVDRDLPLLLLRELFRRCIFLSLRRSWKPDCPDRWQGRNSFC